MKRCRKQAGQVSVEIVLMTVVTVGICLAVSVAARKNQWLADLVSGPWQDLHDIIQYGVPYSGHQSQIAGQHPNVLSRAATPLGTSGKTNL